ncbi:MAG: methylmalonyl-CoA decarboxylase, partial [Deltaproteobacteria bacterium]
MTLMLKEYRDTTGVLTFNHPARRNALSAALIEELIVGLADMQAAGVRAAVLRAPSGAVIWSAGHDVSELPPHGRDPLAYNDPLRRAVRAIEDFPAPVIALVQGSVWGGACEIALTCDLLVATPEVTFAITPAKLGVPYNTSGILNLMKNMSLPVLKEMLFTANTISAERALHAGMVNHILPPEKIEEFTFDLAARIGEMSPLCVTLFKEELRILSESRPLSPEAF